MLQPQALLKDGKYVVERVLDVGGMGAVYLAYDTCLADRQVVIKEMTSGHSPAGEDLLGEDRAAVAWQFRQEAEILANLDHSAVPAVHELFEENGSTYLVMTLIRGKNLQRIIDETATFLPVSRVLDWMDQLCDVLDYLHTSNPPILYRDLKPSNIMLGARDRIHLIDFGIAKLRSQQTILDGAGTEGYCPVEQYKDGGKTDARSDIYALGATLYALLTLRRPPAAWVLKHEPLPDPRISNPCVPADLVQIIFRMMRHDPAHRYQTIDETRRALAAVGEREESAADGVGIQQSMADGTDILLRSQCPQCASYLDSATTTCRKCQIPDLVPVPPTQAGETMEPAAVALLEQLKALSTWCSVVDGAGPVYMPAGGNSNLENRSLQRNSLLDQLRILSHRYPDFGIRAALARGLRISLAVAAKEEGFGRADQLLGELRTLAETQREDVGIRGQLALGLVDMAFASSPAGSRRNAFLGELRTLAETYPTDPVVQSVMVGLSSRILEHVDSGPAPAREGAAEGQKRPGLAAIILQAQSGSTIRLEPGTYRSDRRLEISKPVTLAGDGAELCHITSDADNGVLCFNGGGTLVLRGLTVRSEGSGRSPVVSVEQGILEVSVCHFIGNGAAACGLELAWQGQAHLERCVVSGCDLGVGVRDNAHLIADGNTFEKNGQAGIALFGSATGTVRQSHCSENGKYGIYVGDQAQALLEENICEGNKQAGIGFFDKASGTARGNSCARNEMCGMCIADEAQPQLDDNACEANGGPGLAFIGKATGVARRNRCTDNEMNGILLVGNETQPSLEDNTCEGKRDSGIVFLGQAGPLYHRLSQERKLHLEASDVD